MSVRVSMVFFLLLLILPADAKNKKKQFLPDTVLKAQRVLVVIRPDAGEPLPVVLPISRNPGLGPEDSGPRLGTQIGPSQNIFGVYIGGIKDPLDAPPIWRYSAKNALNGPQVAAVEQFRKAIEESEKQGQQKP